MAPPQLPPADDLYLTAHDASSGRPLLGSAALGLGLGAALLGELILWRRIDLISAGLVVTDKRPTGDTATTALLERILREADRRGLRDWLARLATGSATDLVGRRLARGGLIRRVERRGLLGTRSSFVPADAMTAAWPATRIRTKVAGSEPLNVPDLLVSGLIRATGLDRQVLAALTARDRDRLSEQSRRDLPAELQQLVAQVEAAVVVAPFRPMWRPGS
ncbi:hypothetical protein ACWT_2624 [Actinoplanes sp. SE50]|uniref:GOLPH3/VPS74 family protein n=1 Tax=unclassified Actinoplanes TaxID=2626549 RepID=UPI00023ECE6D|nr:MULTISPECIES: GPP34 family phosphoprotein [unclassified Actinoplanes]AEV83817.1 hypothetical protein ACPL_2922 [Actinoplanes sp. SE50/110]ATO82039.1 hypothetical protein ACWT_2624 [Actinoplanes sp. SE50]SLL99447.1 hypothetical protein ACSP50_2678 [Actinoplanes sp. SE50/110]